MFNIEHRPVFDIEHPWPAGARKARESPVSARGTGFALRPVWRILILDEATSALDTATEYQIQQALSELSQGRTTLVVAHRLATIRNADRIVVMGRDGIDEEGTHKELLSRNGAYARLHNAQFGAVA